MSLAHYYFSLKLCGFELSDIVQNSSWNVVVLSEMVPNFVKSGLGPANLPFELELLH